eukprot:11032233-Lingulodinium_polyedra.AAC.1
MRRGIQVSELPGGPQSPGTHPRQVQRHGVLTGCRRQLPQDEECQAGEGQEKVQEAPEVHGLSPCHKHALHCTPL